MRLEHIDRRVLGAVCCVDATTKLRIPEPLILAAPGVRLVRNLSGCYVLMSAPGFEAYTRSFDKIPQASAAAVELTISDPRRAYLPRRQTIQLPRDPDPQHASRSDSLFQPIKIELYPAPIAPTADRWAVIRATVMAAGTETRLPGALIRVLRAGTSTQIALGLADRRGEALVAVPGIPVTTWDAGTGPVLATKIAVTIQTVFDSAAGEIPDPDAIVAKIASLPKSSGDVDLASGQVLVTQLTVPLP